MGSSKSKPVSGARQKPKTSRNGRFRVKETARGSLVYVYKQDPSVQVLGIRHLWVALDIRPGPASEDIAICGLNSVVTSSDSNNNFLYSSTAQAQEFDAVHTFAAVNHVLTMFRRGLRRMNVKRKLQWHWGEGQIDVYPRAGEHANAFYSRKHRALLFYYFRHATRPTYIYTARSWDVVAHVTGHAVLDALRPRYLETDHTQTRALHESFADLTAMFAMLDQLDLCEAIIAQSKGDLHEKSFLSNFAEEFGDGLGRSFGMRNADNNVAIDEVTDEVHDLSRVFTGAIYDILADMYVISRDLDKYDPAETLYRVGKHFLALLISAFLVVPETDVEFVDVMEAMAQVEADEQTTSIIRRHFENRKIFRGSDAKPRPSDRSLFIASCGTMQVRFNLELRDVLNETCQAKSNLQDKILESARL